MDIKLNNLKNEMISSFNKIIKGLETKKASSDTVDMQNYCDENIELYNRKIDDINNYFNSGEMLKDYEKIILIENLDDKVDLFKKTKIWKMEGYYNTLEKKANPYFYYYVALIVSMYFPLFFLGASCYIYRHGFYQKGDINGYESIITRILKDKTQNNILNEIIRRLQGLTTISSADHLKINTPYKHMINFKNCILKFDENYVKSKDVKFEIIKHSPKYLITYQVNANYNKDLTIDECKSKTKKWNAYLTSCFDDEKEINLLLEKIAYTFLMNRPKHEFTFLMGSGGNGKGVLERFIANLHRNTTTVSAEELTIPDKRSNFFNQKFIDNPVMFCNETDKRLSDMSLLKDITGDGGINIEYKFKNEYISAYRPITKIFISSNHNVKFSWDKGIERRVAFININKDIKKVDKNLESTIQNSEIDFIVFLIINQNLINFIKRNFEFDYPQSHYDLFNKFKEINNPIINFINKHIEVDKNAGISKTELFKLVNEVFMNQFKHKITLYEKFEKELNNMKIDFKLVKGRVKSYSYFYTQNENYIKDEVNTAYYKGIKFVEGKNIIIDNEKNADIDIKKDMPERLYFSKVSPNGVLSINNKIIQYDNKDFLNTLDSKNIYYIIQDNNLEIFNLSRLRKYFDSNNIVEMKKVPNKKEIEENEIAFFDKIVNPLKNKDAIIPQIDYLNDIRNDSLDRKRFLNITKKISKIGVRQLIDILANF